MKFKIINNLAGGRYYVNAKLLELSDEDKEKFLKFGYPLIQIKLPTGKERPVKIMNCTK